jgi:DNA-binding NarL/FixJ family response regulator
MWQHYGIRVFVIERDIYARQSITSYLSWDRRTRVIGTSATPHEMFVALADHPEGVRLDAITLDTSLAADPLAVAGLIGLIRHAVPQVAIICLATGIDVCWAQAAYKAGAAAYLTRESVGPGIAGAVHFALQQQFVVTRDVAAALGPGMGTSCRGASVLPPRRCYDRLTPRIEQALWLCVVEGLPAELAAEEMGVSTSTVRSYIKEGYRILESQDDTPYPPTMSPAERAFMRITALDTERPSPSAPRQYAA